jgi:hypothetical protein
MAPGELKVAIKAVLPSPDEPAMLPPGIHTKRYFSDKLNKVKIQQSSNK